MSCWMIITVIYIITITVEPGYNDIGLYDTLSTQSDIPWYQLILPLTLNLCPSAIKRPVYKDTKYSVPFKTL